MFADAWMWSPFVMLLVLAGLVSVPKYLYEAAAIDRVPRLAAVLTSITFPYIRGLLLLALLFRTIEAFKLFDLVFLLTNGGPGTATETIAFRVYRVAFEDNKTSESAAHRLYPAVHRHRPHKPLSLFRQPARQRGLSRLLETNRVLPSPAADPPAPLLERLGLRSASGVGQAGWGRTLLAAVVSVVYFFPVLWIILTAFKTYEDALAVPAKFIFTPTLENFTHVFSRAYSAGGQAQNTGFTLYFFNSLFISGVSVLLALLIGTLAAFGFSRYPLKGNDTYLFIILTTRMLPAIVVIIPIFIMFRVTGLAGTYFGIIALYTAFNLPFTIWMMKSFFDELSLDVEDAARIDGSSDISVFFKICLPQVIAGLAATAVFGLILTWNEFLFALSAVGRRNPNGARRHVPDHRRRYRRSLGSSGGHRDPVPRSRHHRDIRVAEPAVARRHLRHDQT